MSEHHPTQSRLVGSLAGYDRGENVQYPVPSRESDVTTEQPMEAEAALGTLLMRQTVSTEATEAVQEPLPDLFDEIAQRENAIPHNIIRGEE